MFFYVLILLRHAMSFGTIRQGNEATGRAISKMKAGHDEAADMLPRYDEI